ncbi:MAG: hypothetical protein P1U89_14795 [Verrucomicrobiales bacterium]|nr:hypothetical protein [Verrucomicrobiales bacterium]
MTGSRRRFLQSSYGAGTIALASLLRDEGLLATRRSRGMRLISMPLPKLRTALARPVP